MKLSEIWIYPVKSFKGIQLTEAVVEKRGLQYDRRWMLVDSTGRFISQREFPQLASLEVFITKSGLIVKTSLPFWQKEDSIQIPFKAPEEKEEIEVQVWGSTCLAWRLSSTFDDWFSEKLGTNCNFVYMPDQSKRTINPKFNKGNDLVSFADGYPLLIVGENSLKDLNSRLESPIKMDRFRPNLVFSDGAPFVEDSFKTFSVGEVKFRGTKPCARCSITTINQQSLETGKEPLKTLAKFRRINNDVIFGFNIVPESLGKVCLGDQIIPTA